MEEWFLGRAARNDGSVWLCRLVELAYLASLLQRSQVPGKA